jgi:hypothetical protein
LGPPHRCHDGCLYPKTVGHQALPTGRQIGDAAQAAIGNRIRVENDDIRRAADHQSAAIGQAVDIG